MSLSDVLILSVEAGAGHIRAAQALHSALKKRGIRSHIEDIFTCGPSWVFRFTIGSYMHMLHYTPGLYRKLYDTSATLKVGSLSKSFFNQSLWKYLGPGLKALLQEHKPRVVICTHPFPLGLLSVLKKEESLDLKTAGVVTDFSFHPFWIYSDCDRYYVAAEDLIDEIEKLGDKREKAVVTGIPIDPSFLTVTDMKREAAEEVAALSSASHRILIMGGSLGLGALDVWVNSLLLQMQNSDIDTWQIVVVAGKNKSLEERLSAIESPHLKVYGFTDKIAYLMASSDLLITKPGGLSSSEAIALELPQLLLSPLPGHEERNYQFLLKKDVARGASTVEELTKLTIQLIKDHKERSLLQEGAKKLKKAQAAYHVAEDIDKILSQTSVMGS
ncbi:MGDG synthase family glycosyltransferase [Heliorestis convoluta]|uniref:1,2-diacylglycerol 3-glucosyltransferase, putative n=1 Tax=Heliorestis convoluta TaxID=356322 RepID=A0A5Q2N2W0_9FIRM|nr:glycosyltransferase [Heliorestis convoluta]QGG48213.1 1,2-diacylglycerol 3-glucosyltransferase, putative [Heliorestis convoluta]